MRVNEDEISLFVMLHRSHSSKVGLLSVEGSKGHERMPRGTNTPLARIGRNGGLLAWGLRR